MKLVADHQSALYGTMFAPISSPIDFPQPSAWFPTIKSLIFYEHARFFPTTTKNLVFHHQDCGKSALTMWQRAYEKQTQTVGTFESSNVA